ncbi:MAG: ComEC/Rec2 family competence protein [Verrucomicrobiales bacterium]|nr:ComEC/Rec2 family competence protein [Verrucomicrobiales bacterium]
MKFSCSFFRLLSLENLIRRAPLVVVAVAALLGITFADMASWPGPGLISITFAIFSLILWRKQRASATILTGGALAAAGFATLHYQRCHEINAFPLATELQKREFIEISGKGWIADRVTTGRRSVSTKLHLQTIRIRGVEVPCDHRVPVWIQEKKTGLVYGERVEFSGLLRPLDRAKAPGGFDPASFYYRESGSLARLEVRKGDLLKRLPGNAGSQTVRLAQKLRDHFEKGLFSGMKSEDLPYARLIAAMSLGARENTPEDLEEAFQRSGTMHLFAVSGLHVGVVAGIFFGGLLLCRVPRRTAVLIVIPLILFYAVLTGLRPSAMRAALMLSIVLASFTVKEQPRLLNSLALAALLLLGFDTQQLFLPGFQLSFSVLLFIALFAGPLQEKLSFPWLTDPFIPKTLRGPLKRTKDRFVTGLAMTLAVSLVSWLGSLGLLVWHFQSFAPVGVLANIFMVPLASLVVTLAVFSIACFSLHGIWISSLINQLNVGLTIFLTGLAQFFGTLPGAYQNSGSIDQNPKPASDTITLDVMGERGGSAMLLTFPERERTRRSLWMIDPGGSETYRRQMLPLLRTRAVNRLDALVLTHGDIDHIGEAPTVLSHFQPDLLFESSLPNRSPVYPEIDQLANDLAIERIVLARGQRLSPYPDATLRVLSPHREAPGRLADDRAVVLLLQFGEMSLLLTSDAGFETEKNLLNAGVDLSADVWIRGQHIETPSTLPAFVDAVSPQLVISSSADFPTTQQIPPSLRGILEEKKVPLLELNRTGVITLSLTKNGIQIDPFAEPANFIHLKTKSFPKK